MTTDEYTPVLLNVMSDAGNDARVRREAIRQLLATPSSDAAYKYVRAGDVVLLQGLEEYAQETVDPNVRLQVETAIQLLRQHMLEGTSTGNPP